MKGSRKGYLSESDGDFLKRLANVSGVARLQQVHGHLSRHHRAQQIARFQLTNLNLAHRLLQHQRSLFLLKQR